MISGFHIEQMKLEQAMAINEIKELKRLNIGLQYQTTLQNLALCVAKKTIIDNGLELPSTLKKVDTAISHTLPEYLREQAQ